MNHVQGFFFIGKEGCLFRSSKLNPDFPLLGRIDLYYNQDFVLRTTKVFIHALYDNLFYIMGRMKQHFHWIRFVLSYEKYRGFQFSIFF